MSLLKSNKFVSNPQLFYETIKDNEDVSDLYRQSNETLSQAEFEELLKVWNVDFESSDIQEEEEEI